MLIAGKTAHAASQHCPMIRNMMKTGSFAIPVFARLFPLLQECDLSLADELPKSRGARLASVTNLFELVQKSGTTLISLAEKQKAR